jgi:hypothetical protein
MGDASGLPHHTSSCRESLLVITRHSFVVAILALPFAAHAHGIAGNRYFPGTLTFDDPAVADEAIFPLLSRERRPGASGEEVDTSAAISFVRLLTPTLALGMDKGWKRLNSNGISRFGADPTTLSLKSEVLRNDPAEFLTAASIGWTLAGSGDAAIGANTPHTISPGVFAGKGFGSLPDDLAWLRPFGVTGGVSADLPLRHTALTYANGSPLPSGTGRYADVLHWGFSLQYSTLYLTDRFTGQPPKEEPLKQFVPLVEFAFNTTRGHGTTAVMTPALSYVAVVWQFSVGASIPLNTQTGKHPGVQAQLLFFLDDLIPSLFSKPVFHR